MVSIGRSQRAEMLEAQPDVFYVTDHYESHPAMLIRLSQVTLGQLEQTLQMAWTYVSSETAVRRK
jgi:hypothetical protein